MQHRIVNSKFKYVEYAWICRYLPKKYCSWSVKKVHDQSKMTEYWKMPYRLCVMPFLEVTILFNQHVIIVGNTVGKSPTGILTLFICLVLKPLKLQNVWRIFRPSRVFLYCKYANMHVNCKQIFPWTINNVNICRKHATSYCKL